MRLAQRISKLEKTMTAMTGASERGILIVLHKYPQVPGTTLIGYQDGEGTLWPLNRAEWTGGPTGVLEEVWSDSAKGAQPDSVDEALDPLRDYLTINYFTLTRDEYEALHGDEVDHRQDTETLST